MEVSDDQKTNQPQKLPNDPDQKPTQGNQLQTSGEKTPSNKGEMVSSDLLAVDALQLHKRAPAGKEVLTSLLQNVKVSVTKKEETGASPVKTVQQSVEKDKDESAVLSRKTGGTTVPKILIQSEKSISPLLVPPPTPKDDPEETPNENPEMSKAKVTFSTTPGSQENSSQAEQQSTAPEKPATQLPTMTVTPADPDADPELVRSSPTPVTVNARPFITRLLSNPNMQVANQPSSGSALWKKAMNKAKALTMFQTPVTKPDEKVIYKYYRGRRISVCPVTGRRRSVAEIQNQIRKIKARLRFRRLGKLIIFCMRCVNQHSYKFREESDLTSYMQVLSYMDYRHDQVPDLMFDPSTFRADRQMRISEETKRILSKRKSDRTEQEIYSAQIALRNIKSFAEFPARMQQKMAEVGHYEAYEAKRVITREGHPPAAFYFILSGCVVAMEMDRLTSKAVPAAEYVKGESFEEHPMIQDTPREYTVLTKEPCELLSISNKDFKTIFMQGGVKNINDPDQDTFLRNLSFLDGWPINLLMDHPTKCQFLYFKRGAVVARDTHYSDWIIIVKSGSISVLKKLKKVGPYEWKRKSALKPLTEREKRERKEQKYQWRRFILPELRLPLRKRRDVEEVEERIDGKPKPFKHPEIKVKMEDYKENGKPSRRDKYFYPNLWTYKKGGDEQKEQEAFSNINKQYLYLMTAKKDSEDQVASGTARRNVNTVPFTRSKTLDPRQFAASLSPDLISRSSFTSTPDTLLSSTGLRDTPNSSTQSLLFDERFQTILDGVELPTRPKSENNLSEIDKNPQFVKVQTLVKGQVWGLADLILQEQPSFTVISNGADLVLINKHFYEEHSSERLQRKMRQELCPYPSDDDLQQGLQISVDWQDYRRKNLSSTLQILKRRRPLINTEVPAEPLTAQPTQ